MKKALSIILCLSMLMTSFPVSVFAAPTMAPVGGGALLETEQVMPETENKAQQDAEGAEDTVLAAEGTVSPVKVLPASGETVDYRYPVAYYTFSDDVVINAEDVTLANINNESVGGVYFEEETNTVWVFPYASKAMYGATISFAAWTSNILAADGSALYFPAASFTLSKEPVSDGTNLVPFGDNEQGWTSFHYHSGNKEFTTREYVDDTHKHAALRVALDADAAQEWDHNKTNIIWKPGTTYKVKYSVKFASYSYPGTAAKDTTVTPDFVYKAVYLCSNCGAEKASGSGTDCTSCGMTGTVARDHNSSFTDHTYNNDTPVIGPTKDWVSREFEFATRGPEYMVEESLNDMHFSVYSNPPATGGVNFYIDDVEIYEKVNMTFAAVDGKSALKNAEVVPETLYGYNGDKVTLPVAADYFNAVAANYAVEGWTDGKNVYADGIEMEVKGCKVLTPVLVPTGVAATLTFAVADDLADYYNGLASITVNAGETIDLADYGFDKIAGYDVYWTNADGEKVSGEYVVEADATLTAVKKFREGVKFDSQDAAEPYLNDVKQLILQNATGMYDAESEALVVTPVRKSNGTYDAIVIVDNISVPTAQYAYIDVTLLKADDTPVTEGAAYGQIFVRTTNANWSGDAAYQTRASEFIGYADEEQTKVIYRFPVAELLTGWTGDCVTIRFDPHDRPDVIGVCEIKLVKDEVIDSVEITDLDAPALSAKPDTEATVPADAVYSIEKITWDCTTAYFGGNTEYTVTAMVKINDGVNGVTFGEETVATIGGVEAVITPGKLNSDVATVTCTFPATEEAKDIEIVINNEKEITENNGTLVLDATVVPVNAEDEINPTTVTWAITGGDEGIATLEGNVLKAIWDGTVEITATADYNASEAVTFDVVISGQQGWNVTYLAGTGANVTGVPAPVQAKYDYEVSKAVPTRAGFGFDGWSLVPGGTEAVNELYVEDDVILYAMWSRGTTFIDFKDQSDYDTYITLACAENISVDTSGDGYLVFDVISGSKTGAQAADVQITLNDKKNVSANDQANYKTIPLDDVTSYEIKLATDYQNLSGYGTVLYYTSHDGEGNFYSRPYATGVPDFTANMFQQAQKYSGDINEFVTVKVDTTIRESFKGYLGHARFDPIQGESAVGKKILVDYIRLNGIRAVDYVDVVLDAPVVSADAPTVEDVVASSDAYTIESIEWTPALVEGKFFDDNTAYTAKITAKPATGYVMSEMPAAGFVNGEEADIEYVDGNLVVEYTFDKTADLQDFDLFIGTVDETIEELVISEPYGELALKPIAVSSEEITDPNFTEEVFWSISDEHLATIDENGVVKANLDGTVTVTALSKYDPQVSATVEIKLENQEPERTVMFDKGITEGLIANVPKSVTVKGHYVLPDVVLTRPGGYHFEGWVTEPGGDEFVTETYITEDTTFYAKWAKLLASEEFTDSFGYLNGNSNPLGVSSYAFEDGYVKMVYDGFQREGIKLEGPNANLFDLSVKAEDVEYVEMRFRIDNLKLNGSKGNVAVYVMGTNPDGTATTWSEAARTNFEYDAETVSGDGFYRLRLPASWHSKTCFTGALRKYRIHFNTNNAASSQTVILDYVRFVGKNVDKVEVADITAPVAKAEAGKTATVLGTDYVVTNVEWSPALLGGLFFNGDTAYTAKVTVKAMGNAYMPDKVAVASVNGEKAKYSRVDEKTATVSFTFPATEDVGEITLVDLTLYEKDNDGTVKSSQQLIAGDDFNLGSIKPESVPDGYRWIGWASDEEGTEMVDIVNLTEDDEFYAVYELIEGFEYGNEYHIDGTHANTDGILSFVDGWAVMTPASAADDVKLITPKTFVNAADYGKIEVIYDGSLETTVDGKIQTNRFNENLVPELFFEVSGATYPATLLEVVPCIVSNRVSYKYVYDMTLSDKWAGTIGSITVDPYNGHPAWAVKSIMFVKNEPIEEAVVITGVEAPATWGTPDYDAEIEGNFVIVSGEWSPALNESGKFNPDTAYTATIVVKPVSGYQIVNAEATIDGNEANAVINVDGTMTISYTYEKTEALKPFTFEIEDGAIDVADGTFTVAPIFTPENEGDVIEVQDIILEIVDNGADGNSAYVVDNNTIKAVYDGTIKIKATSVYDPSKSDTATIVITNQVSNYTITYVAGAEGVTNMPATDYAKLDYQLSTTRPVRSGYAFAGWVKNPGDTASIARDYVTSDVTYYALWVKGISYDFIGETAPSINNHLSDNGVYDKANGVYTTNGVSGTDPIITFNVDGIKGADYPIIELRVKSSAANNNVRVYYTSSLVPSYTESAATGVDYSASMDEFTVVRVDMSSMATWTDADIKSVRIDPINKAIDFFEIDYIRLVNYEANVVEIDGIEAPVAKATADTTAKSLTDSVKVTEVTWEPELLYGYYFDGDTEYTAKVTVKGNTGYFVSSVPAVYTINGEEADGYEYDAETETLTVYKTFEATGAIDSSEAFDITLVEADDDMYVVEEVRTIFKGDKFALGAYVPANIPAGYRWIGWTDEDGEFVENITVTGDATYYAEYEALTEFDYANPKHWMGTTSKAGDEGIRFKDDLAIVEVPGRGVDTALITPVTNLVASDYAYVEVYYSATHDGYIDGIKMDNIFNATLINPLPALKYSTPASPDSFTGAGKLIAAEKVMVGDSLTYKYTYDMTEAVTWTGNIGKFYADPYTVGSATVSATNHVHQYPEWAVRKIEFIPCKPVTKDASVTVDAPEAAFAPATIDSVSVNAPYTVKSITWNGEFDENGNFLPETVYTADIVLGAQAGYTLTGDTDVEVNGEEVFYEYNDGTYVVSYEFEATDALEEVEVVISGKNEITASGRYLQLTGKTVSVSGAKLPVTAVTWSIDDESVATVSETGRVYPIMNGTVTVTATSVYDTSVSAEHVITITNQGDLFTVTFNKNTTDVVDGMPEAIKVRGNFVPEECTLVRDGYFFMGWSKDEDALEPDTSFNITEDTVLYAKWAKGYEWNCNDKNNIITVQGGRKATYTDGIAYLAAGTSQIIMEQDVKALKLSTAEHKQLQIRVSLPKGGTLKTYIGSTNGSATTPWNESASQTLHNLPANAEGEFQIVTYDYTNHAVWNTHPTVWKIRFDSDTNMDSEIAIDWIRLYNSDRVVKFDGNGGLIPLYDGYVESYKQTMKIGTINLRSVPVKEGYTFAGWSKNPESFDKLYKGTFTVTDDVTLYAMWTPGNVYYDMDEEAIAETVGTDSGNAEDMTVTSDDNGLSISSEAEVAPTVKIADEIVVNDEHKNIAVAVDFVYSDVTEDTVYLSFVPEGQTEPVYVAIAENVGSSFEGTLICDLSEVAEYTGTVTDVKLVLQSGVIDNYTISEVIISDAETAGKLGQQSSSSTSEERVPVVIGGKDNGTDRNTYPAGSGTITSHAHSTTVKPNKQVTKPAAGGSGASKPSTPAAADYVETKTSASGDIVFEFDKADDEKLVASYRHMAKVSLSNSVLTIKNNGKPEGDKNSPAFFSGKMKLDAASHRYIIIKNNCTYGADTVRIYFTTDGKYSEQQAVNGTLSNGTMGYTVVDMGTNASWKGTITGLFFSVGNKVGNIEIDAIIFTNNKNTVTKSDNKFPFINSFTATTFSDVKSSDWFYGDVEKSYKIGLMNGRDNGTFDPNGNVTLAEAITVASRVNALYNGKTIAAAAAGQKWYDTYVAYAQTAGIIKAGQFADVTRPATRSEVAVMFANAMPAAWFTAKNMFTSIPDVASSDAAYKQILTLYNAGVVVGVDDAYNFQPATNIKRSEISAIINRVVLPESRVKVYTAAELEKMTINLDANKLVGISLSWCEEGKLVLKDGLAYGKVKTPEEGKRPDPIVNCGAAVVGEGLEASLYPTIEIGVKFGDDTPVGNVSNIFFTTAAISWSEKARVDATYDGKKDANGISVLKFNMAGNANWKDTVTSLRFDPFNTTGEFSIAYIKLVPSVK